MAWEVVVGQGAAGAINQRLLDPHEKSPKEYAHFGQRLSYSFYQFSWRLILGEAATAIVQVGGKPTSHVDPHWKEILR